MNIKNVGILRKIWIFDSVPDLEESSGLDGRVLGSRPKGRGLETYRRHCVGRRVKSYPKSPSTYFAQSKHALDSNTVSSEIFARTIF